MLSLGREQWSVFILPYYVQIDLEESLLTSTELHEKIVVF